ncbi:MAG: hypothetical protein R3224_02690 [Balneolaceae bacterium]|nr:hypothetical protein [Balneolaceae bacterium]
MATESDNSKSITLKPSWKQYFLPYLLSVLAIPLFGIGLLALYFVRKQHRRQAFEVTDAGITRTDSEGRRHIDLKDIDHIELQQNWLQEKLGIGTLILNTSASGMNIPGMKRPGRLKETIEQAAALCRQQNRKQNFRERPDPDYKPGSMDKMDYLTGLWHQGLLSDEDFDSEKKNFE